LPLFDSAGGIGCARPAVRLRCRQAASRQHDRQPVLIRPGRCQHTRSRGVAQTGNGPMARGTGFLGDRGGQRLLRTTAAGRQPRQRSWRAERDRTGPDPALCAARAVRPVVRFQNRRWPARRYGLADLPPTSLAGCGWTWVWRSSVPSNDLPLVDRTDRQSVTTVPGG